MDHKSNGQLLSHLTLQPLCSSCCETRFTPTQALHPPAPGPWAIAFLQVQCPSPDVLVSPFLSSFHLITHISIQEPPCQKDLPKSSLSGSSLWEIPKRKGVLWGDRRAGPSWPSPWFSNGGCPEGCGEGPEAEHVCSRAGSSSQWSPMSPQLRKSVYFAANVLRIYLPFPSQMLEVLFLLYKKWGYWENNVWGAFYSFFQISLMEGTMGQ